MEKNNLLVLPFVLKALITRYIKSGVAENAYSRSKMFIVYFIISIIFLFCQDLGLKKVG